MVKVLVLGATGYIGLALSRTLRRSSHVVYGLARNEEKAKLLAQNEIIPVLGSIEKGEYLSIISTANIDIVVDAAGANMESWKVLEGLRKIGEERLTRRGGKGPKLGFIYTSGMWVHGDSKGRVNDLNPAGLEGDHGSPTAPPGIVKWRPELERAVVDAGKSLDTIVLRPALLYGGSGAIWSSWFGAIQKAAESNAEEVTLPVDADALLSLIHVDDTATALQKAVERLPLIANSSAYPVFDAATTREPVRPILEAAAKELGFKGTIKFAGPKGGFEEALNTSLRADSSRMRDLLGWKPERVTGMLDEIDIFVAAWKASQ